MCMMLGYVYNTKKIWRIWDFKSGRTGQAVECSNVVFDEEENAHTEEQTEAIEFRENADELQDEIQEANMNEISDPTSQENSKSRNLVSLSVNWRKPAGLGRSLPNSIFGQMPAGLGRSLLVWAEAYQIQYLGISLPVWADAC